MRASSTRSLRTGREIPVIGLGSWQLTNNTVGTVVRALQLGYRLIDTSGDYGTQPGIGEGLRRYGLNREDVYITSKIEETDDAYQASVNNLKELDTEYVDLMLIHRPPGSNAGQELWAGLVLAQKEGLVRDIGVSNYPISLMRVLMDVSGQVPAVNQIEWSPFGFSENMLKFCQENKIIIQAYSPLTRGKRLDDATLGELAEKYGRSPAQILIRWNLQRGVVPLPKANNPDHLEENIDVFDFTIKEEDMLRLDSLNERYSSLGNLPYA